jgi:sigma-B regulation protein RsbU (phosphoserine phosphatase)
MVDPLNKIIHSVQRLSTGDFSSRIHIETGDELELVAETFNKMLPQLEEHIKLKESLAVAEEVQQNLLPKIVCDFEGYTISAEAVYCDETGGDFYDFFPYGEDKGKCCFVIGDVSGHGIEAALLMATARALIQAFCSVVDDIAKAVAYVNKVISRDVGDTGRFLTLFLLTIEKQTGNIKWVRAGHEPAVIYDPASDTYTELAGAGMLLGVMDDAQYTAFSTDALTPGAVLCIGTDGIWEASNEKHQEFGQERLYKIIKENADYGAEHIKNEILNEVSTYRGSMPQQDDITMVIIKRIDKKK